MEVIVLIGVILGAIFLGFRPKKRPKTSKITVASTPECRSQPPPFDTGSSQGLEESQTLTGLAWITDGDTITIKKTQIRLFGVDAPELNHPYGKNAKWALHKLCKGQTIRAEITDRDQYGRTVARCYLPDGRDLSAEMVRQGLAIDWPKFSGGVYKKLETADARKRLFLADARQKGRMHVWEKLEAQNSNQ